MIFPASLGVRPWASSGLSLTMPLKDNHSMHTLMFESSFISHCLVQPRAPLQWVSCQIRKIAGCACARNSGNVVPAIVRKRSQHASRYERDARAVMHAGIVNLRFSLVVRKTFPEFPAHAQQGLLMRNVHFYVMRFIRKIYLCKLVCLQIYGMHSWCKFCWGRAEQFDLVRFKP